MKGVVKVEEQDPNEQMVAVLQNERAAKNGEPRPKAVEKKLTDIETVMAAYHEVGKAMHKLGNALEVLLGNKELEDRGW
jgi:hypothetical protein